MKRIPFSLLGNRHFFKIFIISIPIYLASFLFVLVIRIISPIIKIRVQRIISQRIGHFIAETELHLCEKSLQKKNNKIAKRICNNAKKIK